MGYRLCLFDGRPDPRRQGLARWVRLDSESDDDALRRAEQFRDGKPAELWRDDELLKTLGNA